MTSFEQKPIGEIVAEDYRTAFVFKQFGLEYCCGGKKSLAEACSSKKIELEDVLSAIQTATINRAEEHDIMIGRPVF